VVSGADHNTDWLDTLIVADERRSPKTQHESLASALTALLLCRIVRPSYQFLASYRANVLYTYTRQVFRPDLFAVIEEHARRSHIISLRSPCRAARSGLKMGGGCPLTSLLLDPVEVVH
jgi:hypothetical protein